MFFDSDTLLSNDLVRAKLSAEELELARDDEDWLPNRIQEQMTTVLTVSMDETEMPGSATASWISEWRGLYFFTSSDVSSEGPFEALEEAMDVDLFSSLPPGISLDSDQVGEEQLVAYAASRFAGEEGETILINWNSYEYNGSGFDVLPDESDLGQFS